MPDGRPRAPRPWLWLAAGAATGALVVLAIQRPAVGLAAPATRVGRDAAPAGHASASRLLSDDRPLIYIHRLPEELYAGGVRPDFREEDRRVEWKQCYMAEWLLTDAFPQMGVTTDDPDRAAVFLIPHLVVDYFHTCMHNRKPCIVATGEYLTRIVHHVQQSRWWQRRQGWDHAIVMAHDDGLGYWDQAWMGTGGGLVRMLQNATFIVNSGSRETRFYDPSRDVVIFPHGTIQPPAALVPASQRRTLAFFGGGQHGRRRSDILDAIQRQPTLNGSTIVVSLGKMAPDNYTAALASARFCLHLPGYPPYVWSGRIAHILQAGCVPVIVMDNVDLPLDRLVDWRLFSVRISEADAVVPGHILSVLHAIPADEADRLQRNWMSMRHTFTFHEPPQPGDMAWWAYRSLIASMRARATGAGLGDGSQPPAPMSHRVLESPGHCWPIGKLMGRWCRASMA